MKSTAVVCAACDFVLDTSFLGDDILDEENRDKSKVDDDVWGESQGERDASFGEDALILGKGADDFVSFEAEDTGFVQRELTNARIYVGAATQSLLRPDAIPERTPGLDVDALNLNPYELHILQFVNGKRPIGRIRRKSGMEDPDVKLAVAMLADKGAVRLKSYVSSERKEQARAKRRERIRKEKGRRGSSSTNRTSTGEKDGRSSKSTSKKSKERETSKEREKAKEVASEKSTVDEKRSGAAPSEPSSTSAKAGSRRPAVFEEKTRAEAMPASLLDELRKGERKAAEPQEDDGAPSNDEATRRRRRRTPTQQTHIAREDNKRAEKPSSKSRSKSDGDDAREASSNQRSASDTKGTGVISGLKSLQVDLAPNDDAVFSGDTEMLPETAPLKAPNDLHKEVTFIKSVDEINDEAAPLSVHDAITGPVEPFVRSDQHGHGFDPPALGFDDDSVLPTGEVPAVSLSLSGFEGEVSADKADSVVLLSSWPSPSESATHDLPAEGFAPDAGDGVTAEVDAAALLKKSPPPLPPSALEPEKILPALPGMGVIPAEPILDLPLDAVSPIVPVVVPVVARDDKPAFAVPIPALPSMPPPLPSMAPPGAPPLPGIPGIPGLPSMPSRPGAVDDLDDDHPAAIDDALADDSDEGAPETSSPQATFNGPAVSFENRRKAERIFEQAERDMGAGKVSSARMNAKLAMIYDPATTRYRESYETWGTIVNPAGQGSMRRDVALFTQAKEREAKGDYKEAVRLLQEAADLNSRAGPVLNLLGVLQATRFKDFRSATDNILKAVDLEPSNLSFKNNLGKVLSMAEDARDKNVDDGDSDDRVKVKKMRPKMF